MEIGAIVKPEVVNAIQTDMRSDLNDPIAIGFRWPWAMPKINSYKMKKAVSKVVRQLFLFNNFYRSI